MPAPDFASEIGQLEAAIASGELTIESNGERVTYRSTDDIKKALAYFENKAAAASPNPAVNRGSFGFSAVAFDRE